MHEFIPFANQTGKCEGPYYPSDPTHVFTSMNSCCYPSMRRCAISDVLNPSEALELKGMLQVRSKGIVYQKKKKNLLFIHPHLVPNP